MELFSWLIQRMEWVYSFVVVDLGLSSKAGYTVIGLLIVLFFFDLFHIYRNRNKGTASLVWLLVVALVPLGTLIYALIGIPMLSRLPDVQEPPELIAPPMGADADQAIPPAPQETPQSASENMITVPTVLGTVVAGLAWVVGGIAVVFFVFIGIALLQCANDPKCM